MSAAASAKLQMLAQYIASRSEYFFYRAWRVKSKSVAVALKKTLGSRGIDRSQDDDPPFRFLGHHSFRMGPIPKMG